MFGDGFALWIAKDRAKTGPVFGSVGMSDCTLRIVSELMGRLLHWTRLVL
ncbi:MAG: hypothetical protein EOO77_17025 [Oxalobacteraceae bacterium]|nr:MAG: hypothetical protein EOO77_17025 [Oxalobacteraceae bacterium]